MGEQIYVMSEDQLVLLDEEEGNEIHGVEDEEEEEEPLEEGGYLVGHMTSLTNPEDPEAANIPPEEEEMAFIVGLESLDSIEGMMEIMEGRQPTEEMMATMMARAEEKREREQKMKEMKEEKREENGNGAEEEEEEPMLEEEMMNGEPVDLSNEQQQIQIVEHDEEIRRIEEIKHEIKAETWSMVPEHNDFDFEQNVSMQSVTANGTTVQLVEFN